MFRELIDPEIECEGLAFTFKDERVEAGETYRYWVEVEDEEGRRLLFETEPIATPALPLTLYQNHPNPFNPSTTIRYYLPDRARVTLEIYDVSGKRIARLVAKEQSKGSYSVEWKGRDEKGSPVTSGVYFYRLVTDKEAITKKMVMLR